MRTELRPSTILMLCFGDTLANLQYLDESYPNRSFQGASETRLTLKEQVQSAPPCCLKLKDVDRSRTARIASLKERRSTQRSHVRVKTQVSRNASFMIPCVSNARFGARQATLDLCFGLGCRRRSLHRTCRPFWNARSHSLRPELIYFLTELALASEDILTGGTFA